jgi:predicted phage-related endonuclease
VLVVGTTQVSVPCSKLAVQFTDNKEEAPLLDSDIIDLVIKKEFDLSVSETPVTGLNRPPALSSTSSSNHSNVSYKKTRDVLKAQTEYDSQLDLERFHDIKSDSKLEEFSLKLPISNELPDDYRRFIEIYTHLRTQMLVCL